MYNKEVGNFGENLAARYLNLKGYKIIKKNFRTKFGEIDLIAKKEEILVFVEVKTRSSNKFGEPSEAVNFIKTTKIIKTANYFISYFNIFDYNIRFDVIEIFIDKFPRINHIIDAFRQ